MEKEKAQKLHFKNRMLERLGIISNNDLYRSIITAIKTCSPVKFKEVKIVCVFKEKQSNRIIKYNTYFNGEGPFTVVFDDKRETLVTIF